MEVTTQQESRSARGRIANVRQGLTSEWRKIGIARRREGLSRGCTCARRHDRVECLFGEGKAGVPRTLPRTPETFSVSAVTHLRGPRNPTSGPAWAAAAARSFRREALVASMRAGLVGELPPETTEPMISAVKRRLGGAIAALDEAERAVTTAAGGSAA